jgi:hypothetical protein
MRAVRFGFGSGVPYSNNLFCWQTTASLCFYESLSRNNQGENKMQTLNLTYHVPISETDSQNGVLTIKGIAISSTVTSNNHKFLPEELRNAYTTLKGVPLLLDHKNEVNSIVGRVIGSEFVNNSIFFEARVMEESIQQKIRKGLINSVSVGAQVSDLEEINGVLIPHGIVFKELSVVAVPADSNAQFTISQALQEAWKPFKPQSRLEILREMVKVHKELNLLREREKEAKRNYTLEYTKDLNGNIYEVSVNFKQKPKTLKKIGIVKEDNPFGEVYSWTG